MEALEAKIRQLEKENVRLHQRNEELLKRKRDKQMAMSQEMAGKDTPFGRNRAAVVAMLQMAGVTAVEANRVGFAAARKAKDRAVRLEDLRGIAKRGDEYVLMINDNPRAKATYDNWVTESS